MSETANGQDPSLSVVTMLYRSAPFIREFYRRIVAAAETLSCSFEIVFVDDGSPDDSARIVRELVRDDPRVVLVELSRNFGHHPAAVAGLAHARGERIFIIDIDLEEKPEWLADFAADWERSGADVVYGVNRLRRGTLSRKLLGGAFWKMFNMLSETKLPANSCTVRMMSRRYLDALLTLPDRNLFLAGNYAWTGFPQLPRVVEKGLRAEASTYGASRLVALFLEALTSFTSYPLRLIFVLGVSIATIAVVAGAVQVVRKLLWPESISLGWPSLMVSIWFLGGVIIAFLGVIGIYLSKVFNEAKARPLFIVRDVHRHRPGADATGSRDGR